MSKHYLEQNVYDAAMERIAVAFAEFDNVLIAFSGGKDSGICVNLCRKYAAETGQFHKLAVYHEDYEAGYPQTFDYVERVFHDLPLEVRKYWLCLPISAACAVSMYQTSWIPWNRDERELWVRTIPKDDYVIHEDNVWFDFKKGTYGADLRKQFAREFAKKHGSTAVIVGLRGDESLSRLAVITSDRRREMHKNLRYTKVGMDRVCNFYPIYDWGVEDVWTANGKFGWDYNRLYDLFYRAGLSLHQMRTASPFHQCGIDSLKLFRAISPDMWGKMVSRVNGVNFAGIYGGTTAMGWQRIKKPPHFTWEQYAGFLISTLPPETRERFEVNIDRIMQTWATRGHGRNPDVIKTMEREGVDLEYTGVEDHLCTKDNYYEIVKIKSGMPEETSIPLFRKCPSWKGVCITILKNDFTGQYMGCSRTKADMDRRAAALKKYRNL